MNDWYMLALYIGAQLLSLVLCAAALAVMIHGIVKQKPLGGRLAFLVASGVLTAAVLLFTNSHATYYRFNDWVVSGSSAQDIIDRYGEPELGGYTPGKSGRLGYYIFTDNGPIMPDHLPHYYYIEFDDSGKVTEYYEDVAPGG